MARSALHPTQDRSKSTATSMAPQLCPGWLHVVGNRFTHTIRRHHVDTLSPSPVHTHRVLTFEAMFHITAELGAATNIDVLFASVQLYACEAD
jgi:hypothetical protein